MLSPSLPQSLPDQTSGFPPQGSPEEASTARRAQWCHPSPRPQPWCHVPEMGSSRATGAAWPAQLKIHKMPVRCPQRGTIQNPGLGPRHRHLMPQRALQLWKSPPLPAAVQERCWPGSVHFSRKYRAWPSLSHTTASLPLLWHLPHLLHQQAPPQPTATYYHMITAPAWREWAREF